MAARGKKAAALCAWALALAACLACCAWLAGRVRAGVPAAVQVSEEYGVGATLAQAQEKLPAQGAAAWQRSTLADGTAVWAVAATAGYGQAACVPVEQGSWYGADAVLKARRLAVVPDTLGGGCAPGARLEVGGQVYTVCGMYSAGGRLARAAGDGRPVLYLSAPVQGQAEELQAQQLVLAQAFPGQRAAAVTAAAGEELPGLYGSRQDLASLGRLPGALLRLGAAAGLALPVFWLFSAAWRRILALYDGALAGKSARAQAPGALAALAFAGAGLLAVGGLVGWVDPPAAYLPPDDLFDLAHYADLAADFLQRLNGAFFPDPLTRTGAVYALAAAFLAAGLAVCLAGFFAAARRLARALRAL